MGNLIKVDSISRTFKEHSNPQKKRIEFSRALKINLFVTVVLHYIQVPTTAGSYAVQYGSYA